MRLVLALLALLIAAPADAAPFDCSMSFIKNSNDFGSYDLSLPYQINRHDRVAVTQLEGYNATCSFGGSGLLDTMTRSGLMTFLNGDQYVMILRGDMGQSLFDTDVYYTAPGDFLSATIPFHRIDFSPVGGKNLSYLFPNGLSMRTRCHNDNCDNGPAFFYITGEEVGTAAIVGNDGGLFYQITTVPVPASAWLLSIALGGLWSIGRARMSRKPMVPN